MQKWNEVSHTNFDNLIQEKIHAFQGRATETNMLILETIAIDGPQLKYDVHKKLNERRKTEYSTVTRRIDSLKKRGYLAKASERITERGTRKKENMYGITWKGFIASLAIKKVRESVLQVVEKNPLLSIPEKEFVLLVLKEVFDSKEIEEVSNLLLQSCLKGVPNLETIQDQFLPMYILQGISQISSDTIRIEVFEGKKDLTKLLDNPRILQLVKERILPFISQWRNYLQVMLQVAEKAMAVGDFINELQPADKPSERLKEYLKTMSIGFEEQSDKSS